MAKESKSTRLPQLGGVSRIPLPGSKRISMKRPSSITPSLSSVKPTKIFRSPNLAGTYLTKQQQQRPSSNSSVDTKEPSSYSPSQVIGNGDGEVIKKTFSSELGINSGVNVFGKQTKNSSKKYSDVIDSMPQTRVTLQETVYNNTTAVQQSCATLVRSETFVCVDSKEDILRSTQHCRMVQSTPVPQLKRISYESTPLPGYGGRHNFCAIPSLDDITLSETITLTKNTTSLKKPLDSKMLDSTITLQANTQATNPTKKTLDHKEEEKSNKIVNADRYVANIISPVTKVTTSNRDSPMTNVSTPSGLDNNNITAHQSPVRHIQLLNVTKDTTTPLLQVRQNTTQLLYMTPKTAKSTPDWNLLMHDGSDTYHPMRLLSPNGIARCATGDAMESTSPLTDQLDSKHTHDLVDQTLNNGGTCLLQDVNNIHPKKAARFSFGLDLTDSTLDCSIELVDNSMSSTAQSHSQAHEHNSLVGNNTINSSFPQQQQQQLLKRHGSFDPDESLGILTPDQMKEFMGWTESHNTNNLELQMI